MSLQFQPYGNPLIGEELKQKQFDTLNNTLGNISQQAIQSRQFNMEQALRQQQAQREQTMFDQQQAQYQRMNTPQGQLPNWNQPGQGDLSMQPSYGQSPTPQSPNPLSIFNGGSQTPQVPQESSIVQQHKQMYPHLSSGHQSASYPGMPQGINDLYNDPTKSPADIERGIEPYKTGMGFAGEKSKMDYQTAQTAAEYAKAQKDLSEAKGGGAAGIKSDQAALKDMQDSYNKDKNIVAAQGTLDKLVQAKGLLQAGTINNTIAKQALQTALTFVSTGGQRVNESELKAFLGGQTKSNKLNQWFKSIDEGTLTPRDAEDIKGVIDIYEKSAKKNVMDRGMSYAKQLGQRTGKDSVSEYKRLTGEDYQQNQETNQSSNFNHESIPQGTIYQAPDGSWRKKS